MVEFLNDHLSGKVVLEKIETELFTKELVRRCNKDIFFFAKYVLGFNKMVKRTHGRWADALYKAITVYSFMMFLKPRKTFKTSFYGEAFILWLWAVFGSDIRVLYTSMNKLLIDEVAQHINKFLKKDPRVLYQFLFNVSRDDDMPNTRYEINLTGSDEEKGKSLVFRTAGADTVGIHPHVIVVDDPCGKKDRESKAERDQKKLWFQTLIPLLEKYEVDGWVIKILLYSATKWHYDDLTCSIIRDEDRNDESMWHIEVESLFDKNGKLMYPEIYTHEELRLMKSQMSDEYWATQMLNEVLPESMQKFDKKRFHWFDYDDRFHETEKEFIYKEGTNYCIFDPSQGERDSDYPAVIWVNKRGKTLDIFDAIDEKYPLEKILVMIAQKNLKYGVPMMIYEESSVSMLKKNLKEAHAKLGHKIVLKPIKHTTSKRERIMNMQPWLYNGSVRFRKDYEQAYQELMDQLIFYGAWGFDDFPDVIETAIAFLIGGSSSDVFTWYKNAAAKVDIPVQRLPMQSAQLRPTVATSKKGMISVFEHNRIAELDRLTDKTRFDIIVGVLRKDLAYNETALDAMEEQALRIRKIKGWE